MIDIANHSGPRIHAIDEKFLRSGIGVVEEQLTKRSLPIPSGTTGFLVVGLHASRDFKMHHKAHVGAVDSHSEGIRRHCDIRFF